MNNNQQSPFDFVNSNNIIMQQHSLNQANQLAAAATTQKRFQLVQPIKKQDFQEDDIIDQDQESFNKIYENKVEIKLLQEKNNIDCQNYIVNEIYQQIISEQTFILLANIQKELSRLDEQILFKNFQKELESIFQNIEQKIYNHLNTFVLTRLMKNFQLLLRFDSDYQLLIKKYLHFVYKSLQFDEKRMKFDINLYFLNDASDQQLNPQNWIYLPKQYLLNYLEHLQSVAKQSIQSFYSSPFETLIEEGQEEYSFYDLDNPSSKLLEISELRFIHFIRNSIELNEFQIISSKKQYLKELLIQFFQKYNEDNENKIELLVLYKKIEMLYKEVINDPIQKYKNQVANQLLKNISSYMDYANNQVDAINLSELQEPIIEFVNTYYLNYQINAYLNKIKKIIQEYKQNKSKQSEVKMETSQTLIQEILQCVSSQYVVSFKEILTSNTVKALIQYVKENKLTQVQKNTIQQKELTLLLCKCIGFKVYSNQFQKWSQQISMTSIQSNTNNYFGEKKSNQNNFSNSSKLQEKSGNQQNNLKQSSNNSFSQNKVFNSNLLRTEEITVFKESTGDEDYFEQKKTTEDYCNNFLQKFNEECQLESHSYEIFYNFDQQPNLNSNNHYVVRFLDDNYFVIIKQIIQEAKLIIFAQINKQPDYLNKIVNYVQDYYKNLNMLIIQQNEFNIFKYMIQKQIPQDQKGICFSGLISFLLYVAQNKQIQLSSSVISTQKLFEFMSEQFQSFNEKLQFVYRCQLFYNLQIFSTKISIKYSSKLIEKQDGLYYNEKNPNKLLFIEKNKQYLIILDNYNQSYFYQKQQDQQKQNELGNQQLNSSESIEVHLSNEQGIQIQEIISLIKNSRMVVIQILISNFEFDLEKDENNVNIFLTTKLKDRILSTNLKPAYQIRYCKEMSTQISFDTKNSIKLNTKVLKVDINSFKSKSQLSIEQIFENVINFIQSHQRTYKYILIYDFQNKNIVILNSEDLKQNIYSLLLILLEGFQDQSIINKLNINFNQNTHILNIQAQEKDLKSLVCNQIENSINKVISVMQNYSLKNSVFSLLLRDFIQNSNIFQFNI
ncbi:hypothetical protein ABPG72_013318 [Tetrahymena utriculariae]